MAERLNSWKEIAAYLGREVRTVQRWARTRNLPVHRLPGGDRPRVFTVRSELDEWLRAPGEPRREESVALAVLPFLNLAGSAKDQCFGDGLADDVINELVRIPGLRVIARTSSFAFSARGQDVREIGARLRAAWLLEGSVRRDRRRVRVSAQLVSTRDGCHVWSGCYERDLTDLFTIQNEIACAIAAALEVRLAPAAAVPAPPDLAAWELWVRGRTLGHHFKPREFAEARACYESAIARDPDFARPYFGLADLLFYAAQFGLVPPAEVMPLARAAIHRAIDLDPRFGDSHALEGVFRGLFDHDWPGAEAAFQRAVGLSPGSAAVRTRHAWFYLVPRLRLAEAIGEAQQAVALDPLSPMAHGNLGLSLLVARDYERAAQVTRSAVDLAPGLWWLRWFHATALLYGGQVDEGLREARSVCGQMRRPLVVGALAAVCGLFGEREEARQLLAELEAMDRVAAVPPQAFALAHLGLGNDEVFDWLERAIIARDPLVTHLPSMPIYDGLRNDPRFHALLVRIGLAPQAGASLHATLPPAPAPQGH